MNVAAGPKLAAAVTNAGGLGVIGGMSYTPDMLKEQIDEMKSYLHDKNAPFGIDLLIPQVGGNARKTKYVRASRNKYRSCRLMLIAFQLRLHKGQAGSASRHYHRVRRQALCICRRCTTQGSSRKTSQARCAIHEYGWAPQARPEGARHWM